MQAIELSAYADPGRSLAIAGPLPVAGPPPPQAAFAMQAVDVERTALFDLGAA
jgi:hypothetical protein